MRCGSVSRPRPGFLSIAVIAALFTGGDYCFSGSPTDSLTAVRGLEGASSFCVTPSGATYVLESGKSRLLRYSPDGRLDRQFGGYGWGGDGLDGPADIAAISDLELYVADLGNDRVVRFDPTLGLASIHETREGPVPFRFPRSVAVTDFGQLLVVDGENGRVVELGKDGRVSRIFGGSGVGPGFLRNPVRVRSDGHDRVIVRDDNGLVVFDTFGKHLLTLGAAATGAFTSFDHYRGGVILLDSNTVRVISPDGGRVWETDLAVYNAPSGKPPVDIRSAGERYFILYTDRIISLIPPADAVRPR